MLIGLRLPRALIQLSRNSLHLQPFHNPNFLFYLQQSTYKMPPRKRNPTQKKDTEQSVPEPALKPVESNEETGDVKDDPEIDNPVEEVPAKKPSGRKQRNGALKGDNKEGSKNDENSEDKIPPTGKDQQPAEEHPNTRGRRRVQAAKAEHEDVGEPAPEEKKAGNKRGGKKEEKKNGAEPVEKKEKIEEINYDCDKTNKKGGKWNLKISTWNVAGMRAWVKKNGVDYINQEDADIVCLQETKCPESKVPPEAKVEGYHMFWANSVKDGYAGVALYSKEKPLNVTYGINNEEYDDEGRAITAEFEKFYLVTTYVPNSGQGLKTLPKRMGWDKIFLNHLKELDAKKPVIICGDMNVAHEEIDLANPKTNTKHAGFTKEERDNMTELLKEGFVDSFRQLYPDKTGCYTFWTFMGNARARNTGWRLDYFIVSERLMDSVCDVAIRNQVLGSDHCPVTLFIEI